MTYEYRVRYLTSNIKHQTSNSNSQPATGSNHQSPITNHQSPLYHIVMSVSLPHISLHPSSTNKNTDKSQTTMRSYILTLAIFLLSSCGIDASIHKPKNVAIQPTWHHRDNAQKKINIRGGQSGGTATMSTEIFNLVKSIVGAGVLSLPAGIAAFGDAPSAVIPAVTLITVIGTLSAYGFSLIGRVCAVTNASTYREAWDRTVGTSTSWITAFSSTFSCLFANLAYSMILADTFQNLLKTVGVALTRTQTLFGVTAFILTPLCLLKDLSSLAPFSLLGIMGMAYTAIAMAVRYFGGSYDAVVGGQFANDVAPAVFGSKGATSVLSPNSFILISMLSTAYMVSD